MKINYSTSQITNPILANLRQWVINVQEYVYDSDEVIKDLPEMARLLEFWRSQYNAPEAKDIEVVLFSETCILIKDESRGEYIQVDKAKEVIHA